MSLPGLTCWRRWLKIFEVSLFPRRQAVPLKLNCFDRRSFCEENATYVRGNA